jgi:hypothetical protein
VIVGITISSSFFRIGVAELERVIFASWNQLNENDSDSRNHLLFHREKGYGLVKMLSVHPYIYMC